MAKLSLYLDENIQTALADALTIRGVEVITTKQGGNIGLKMRLYYTLNPEDMKNRLEYLGAWK
jgi:hypothetical protein